MEPYSIYTHTGGDLETNAYFLTAHNSHGNASNVTLCFDAPADTLQALQKRSLRPNALILTHGHFDHITEASRIAQQFHIPVYIHPDDAFMIETPQIFSIWGIGEIEPVEAWQPLSTPPKGQSEISFFGIPARLFHIPGHSPGSVAIYFPAWNLVFGGDILFSGGVGRWDLPGGDEKSLINGITQHLLALPDDTRVFPGHGPSTTIGRERRTNIYLQG